MPEAAEEAAKGTVKEIEFEGYQFSVDTELLDNVETLEVIDRIENKGQVAAIIPLLKLLIGTEGYEGMKAHFVKAEGKFKASKLPDIYAAIIKAFDPKA